MQGYSPLLPLSYDKDTDGVYRLNKTTLQMIKQNLEMVLLTEPGERIMMKDFGVGLKKVLFELDNQQLRSAIISRITSQVTKYLNYIRLDEINISPPDANQENTMFIQIKYSVPILNQQDVLTIKSDNSSYRG